MVINSPRDAHARPPEALRALFKRWQKASLEEINDSPDIFDVQNANPAITSSISARQETFQVQESVFSEFSAVSGRPDTCLQCHRYFIETLPGLIVYPSLIPMYAQSALLDKLLHRDLSNPQHKTNIHLHYDLASTLESTSLDEGDLPLRKSLFAIDSDIVVNPKDLKIHKPVTVRQVLSRKLRWITLGGQYDWTAKVYPAERPPTFPADISTLLQSLFPGVNAQAAIVNLYSPGDTLSVHRDVSEECDRGLISISIGCDGLFIVGNDTGAEAITLRLRSGDAVLMSAEARFAWHAVPKILSGTCPNQIRDWPVLTSEQQNANWNGWLANKRINLNVRQMRLEEHLK